ncbi:Neprilysin-1 [Toxocara canis]|uniref:Neprilysin-1 n=1 Tax=Toxocara canis TaxID=6265 RepID=A0A0B2VA80_TOXCA|nr:Neprilysin-1 [Toxocara canis]
MGNATNLAQIVLLNVILVAVLATIALSTTTFVKVYKGNNRPSSKVAKSIPSTVFHYNNGPVPPNSSLAVAYAQLSDLFLSMINISVNPCNDFYAFTCGNYDNPAGMSFDQLDYRNMRIMAEKINDPAYRDSPLPKPVKQLFDYFETCKDAFSAWTSITKDATYVKSKLQMFQAATELSFPLLQQDATDPTMPNGTTLATAIGYLNGVLQTPTFLSFGIDTNWKDPQSTQGYMLMIDHATLTFPVSYYLKAWDFIKVGYRDRIMIWMNQLAPSLNQTKLGQDVDDMMRLERRFVTDLITDATTRRKFARSFNRYTRQQAEAQYPFIDWHAYLKRISTYADVSIQARILQDDFEFIIMEPVMLAKLGSYLSSDQFTARTIINYFNYRIIDTFGSFMPPIWGAVYEKVEVRRPGVGRPRLIRRRPTMKFLTTQLDLACAASTVDAMQYANARVFIDAMYPTPNDRPELNSITLPAGILQKPYYDENWPTSINYGGLALVAAHELTHGFDDEGVQWNGMGALEHWMTNISSIGFYEMAACVVDEYNGFCPLAGTGKEPSCINGEQTQGENIADNGGIHAAWIGYQTHMALDGPDPQLPDPIFSQFTHDQLFFMSFAHVWCRMSPSDDALYRQIITDPHSPSTYRVFGTIQNFPAFRAAFNCPAGVPYSPLQHCSVWMPKEVP